MSTDLAVQAPPAGAVSSATMETVITGGDLSKLTPKQRVEWYVARCDAAGLDPRTQPFLYIILNGKLTLYATKAASDQLIAGRKLDVQIVDRRSYPEMSIYEVQCRVKRPDGSVVDDVGAVNIKGVAGDALCNAIMKCVTKAKRRTVLSACGLGMLDETEVDSIPGASRVAFTPEGEPENGHANGNGHSAPEHTDLGTLLRQFEHWRDEWVTWANDWWQQMLSTRKAEVPAKHQHPYSKWLLSGHLCRWAAEKGWMPAADELSKGSLPAQTKGLAPLWDAHHEEFNDELTRYVKKVVPLRIREEIDKAKKPASLEPAEDEHGDAYEEDAAAGQ